MTKLLKIEQFKQVNIVYYTNLLNKDLLSRVNEDRLSFIEYTINGIDEYIDQGLVDDSVSQLNDEQINALAEEIVLEYARLNNVTLID